VITALIIFGFACVLAGAFNVWRLTRSAPMSEERAAEDAYHMLGGRPWCRACGEMMPVEEDDPCRCGAPHPRTGLRWRCMLCKQPPHRRGDGGCR
jgi:hypothetical protein